MKKSSTRKISPGMLTALIGPGLAVYTFVIILPLITAFIYSLTNWSLGSVRSFIAFDNYIKLFRDEIFWKALGHNVFIVLANVIIQMALAFILTVLFSSKATKAKGFHRTVIFLPVVLSAVVVGYIWQMIYSNNYGLLNLLLKMVGLENLIRPWLDDPKVVLVSVTVPLIWQYIGVPLIIFMSAVQGIPKDIYEVCELDGVTGVKKALYITFPLISDSIKVAIMLSIASNMLVFTHINVMTGGGPGTSSMVLAQYAYNVSFVRMQYGYGSAISIGIFIISFAMVVLFRKLTEVRK